MYYKTRLIILIIIIIVLIIAVVGIYYSWQNRTSQPVILLNQNQPIDGEDVVGSEVELNGVKTAAPIGTLAYCQLFDGGQYTTCVLNLAYKDNNLQYCALVDDASLKEHCNNRVSLQKAVDQNINQCFGLAEVVQKGCVLQYLDKATDKNKVCDQLQDQSQQEICQQLIPSEEGPEV